MKRKRTIKVYADEFLYEAENGEELPLREGQWVEFRRKMTGADYRVIAEFSEVGDSESIFDMIDALPAVYRLLAKKIVAWNWADIDEDGEPLPTPQEIEAEIVAENENLTKPEIRQLVRKRMAEVLENLDLEDVTNLVLMLSEAMSPSKKALPPQ